MNLRDLSIKELQDYFKSIGEPSFRGSQLFTWLSKGIESFDEITDFSKELRISLSQKAADGEITLGNTTILERQVSKDGTIKYLFELEDGNAVESVFMKYKYGNSICISSQAGCRMGCAFCASTLNGLDKNLSPGELLMQIIAAEKDTGEKINHVVIMGSGEPFDNYDNIIKFLNLVHEPKGLNLGLRNITVSTCGIVPKITDFAKDMPQVNLAISLHAPTDEMRSSIMPINKKYPITELLKTCDEYVKQTNRRITFEYALIKGFNDTEKDAKELATLLRGRLCHVNLIPLNSVKERNMSGTAKSEAAGFLNTLNKAGIPATLRRELGSDIDAACGQLRHKHK